MTKRINKQIDNIIQKISELGIMTPGSLSKQFNICGTPGCKCKDKKKPKKHGPYYNLSYTFKKKSHTKFIPSNKVKMTKEAISNYKKFKKLIEKLVENKIKLFDMERSKK